MKTRARCAGVLVVLLRRTPGEASSTERKTPCRKARTGPSAWRHSPGNSRDKTALTLHRYRPAGGRLKKGAPRQAG